MPQIPQYDNPINTLEPSNLGASADEIAARRVGALYRQAGESVGGAISGAGRSVAEVLQSQDQQDSQKEISQGQLDLELFKGQHTSAYTDALKGADPNTIAQVAGKGAQQLDDFSNSFLDKFQTKAGQDWAQKALGNYKAHFVAQTFADAALGQGQAVASNIHQSVNAMVGAVVDNPTMLDHQMSQVDQNIDALTATFPNLTPEAKAKVENLKDEAKQQLAVAGIKSAMDTDPQAGLAMLATGKYHKYLGEHVESLQKYADTSAKINRADARAERQDQRDAVVDADRKAQGDIVQSLQVDDETGNVTYPAGFGKALLQNPNLQGPSKEAWIRRYQQDLARGAKDQGDPQVFSDFTRRLVLGADDQNRLTQDEALGALADRKLTIAQYNFFDRQLKEPRDPAVTDMLKQTQNEIRGNLNPSSMSPADFAAQTRATTYLWSSYESGLARGLSPQQLLDKDSPTYIFKGGFDQFKNIGADAVDHPSNHYQQAASDAVDIAVQVDGLGRNNKPEEVNDILRAGGVKLDVRDNAWCAALVNSALKQVGLPGTGSQLASSFRTWGFPVQPGEVQKGDVFYSSSGTNEGYTGHVGFLTGKTRNTPGKGMEVQVISSHKQGNPDNAGGVEWRSTDNMVFRRAKPPLGTVMAGPSAGGLSALGEYFFGTRTKLPPAPSEE